MVIIIKSSLAGLVNLESEVLAGLKLSKLNLGIGLVKLKKQTTYQINWKTQWPDII